MDHYQAIQSLLCQYGFTIDTGQFEQCAELFTHGQWQLEGREPMIGKAGFLSGLQGVRLYDDGTPKTKHLITNIDITIADNSISASSESYVTVLQQTEDFPLQTIFSGHYFDKFKQIEGEWYFSHRLVRYALVGDMRAHLTMPKFQ